MLAPEIEPGFSDIATLVDLLRRRASQQPTRMAYTFLSNGEEQAISLTYQELELQARALAARLQAISAPGDRALLLYPSSLDFIVAFFGCLYAGIVAVPAYPPHPKRPDARINAIVNDAQATVALTTSAILEKVTGRIGAEADLAALQWLATDQIDLELAAEWRAPAIDEQTLAFLQYTSGSTSTPRGVMVTHTNLLWNLADLVQGWQHTHESVMVTWLPLFHDMGLICGILLPLYRGFACYFFDPVHFLQKPIRWLEAISKYRGTHSGAPNFAYELCVEKTTAEQRTALDLSSWRMALNAAEPVRIDTMRRFAALYAPHGFDYDAFCPGYGLAEATVKVTSKRIQQAPILRVVQTAALERGILIDAAPDETQVRTFLGCGHSEVDADIRIVQPESRIECPPDQVGEIWVSSPSVAQGYWRRPEASRDTFQAYLANTNEGPFMRTGDLGFLYDGQPFITGRIKDLIIIRGLNHYPQDIELTVERAHESLRPGCGAAFALEVAGEERLVVVQEVHRTYLHNLDENAVLSAIRQAITQEHELQPYAVALVRPNGIFKTSSGKVQRQACRKAFLTGELPLIATWQQPAPEASQSPAAAPTEAAAGQPPKAIYSAAMIAQQMRVWLSQKLHVPVQEIDPNRPFAEFGLDSMLLVELLQMLQEGVAAPLELETTLAWSFPTVTTLAAHLADTLNQIDAASHMTAGKGDTNGAAAVARRSLVQSIPTPEADLADLSEAELVDLLAQEVAHARKRGRA